MCAQLCGNWINYRGLDTPFVHAGAGVCKMPEEPLTPEGGDGL